MEVIADFPRSTYRNKYPWNCLYWDGSRWFGDCVNIQKALLGNPPRDVDHPTKDSWQNNFSNTGDCTEYQLLGQCTDISSDFSRLKAGEPRILYKEGHIGAYLGKEKTIYKGIVNCVECTPAWEDGIQYSYVDSKGGRYSYKGAAKSGAWTHHGKATKWVDYTDVKPEPTPTPTPEPTPKPTKEYSDVKPGDSGYKAIMWATEQGIVQGYSDGTFRPKEPCTREQICTMLWRQAGRPEV